MRLLQGLAILAVVAASSIARADDDCTCDVTPAACDAACACDSECEVDWSADECAAPDAGCVPETDPDDATLDATEAAAAAPVDPVEWPTACGSSGTTACIPCPDGATLQAGRCVADPSTTAGGCAATPAGGIVGLVAVLALVIVARRRKLALALLITACTQDTLGWDDVLDAPITGTTDVFAADLGDGAQFLLEHQPLADGAAQPVAAFALSRAVDAVPIARVAGPCGDRLVATTDGELLGWARAEPGAGTAALVELAAPTGCAAYETDPEAIDGLVAAGYTITATLGYVWPPGAGDPPEPEPAPAIAAAPCTVTRHSPVELLYASPGADETLRFLIGCPGEVIVGEKREGGPAGAMRTAAAHAAGGRTAFVLDRHGDKLRALLARPNGVERTAAYLRHKLAVGYDYLVLDEVTAAGDYADGQTLNRKLRRLLLRIPARTFIPYISIDLLQEKPFIYMQDRRLLLRAFQRRARSLALEVYLHTGQVMAGAAPSAFRRAADRLALAVHGLAGTAGINRRAIITIGTSMHSSFAQYRYLDQPAHDLAAIAKQVNAIRHGSRRLRSQHGLGWYFVNKSDMAPPSAYSYDALIRRMRLEGLRFR